MDLVVVLEVDDDEGVAPIHVVLCFRVDLLACLEKGEGDARITTPPVERRTVFLMSRVEGDARCSKAVFRRVDLGE
jgi:hypothetical protein